MQQKYIEQEVKYSVKNVKDLVQKLKSIGAKDMSTDFQRTVRFDTPNDDLEKKGIFLRVRSGHGNVITMKKKIGITDDNVFEREEIETTVEDLDKMRQIIFNLGFEKELIMEKYRSNWLYKNATISIDELPFGCFVEIEASPEIIDQVSKDLGLDNNKRITVTYWSLFDDYKKANNISDDSIMFPENYKSILG